MRLLLQHQNDLLRYVLPLVGCMSDAQDVVQETATALWKKFDEYDPAQPFLPWAKQFARNEVLMHHRRKRRYTFLTEELIDALTTAQSQRDELSQQRQMALQQCLAKLPAKDRELIECRYAGDSTTIQALAEQLGQTANVLYKSLGRIRRQLFDCIHRKLAAT